MVVHNPNNWHWIDRNCLPWSKDYFNEKVVDTAFENEQYRFVLSSVDSVTGDCDVTQRKGKVLCIYDMKLSFSVNGEIKGSEEEQLVKATISIPEFVHDQDEDDYVFEISADEKKAEIRKYFVPLLKEKLLKFQGDLLEAHAQEVQHSTS
ncbi:activator of Hsp90 ATPase [Scheffersomyces xylosifermentans]|uniref:activator of Hsp90 ATPase n=1 Tax=Scheffersomyces xylosifermentans TaxID=1304137 RepID=UPI00315DD501